MATEKVRVILIYEPVEEYGSVDQALAAARKHTVPPYSGDPRRIYVVTQEIPWPDPH